MLPQVAKREIPGSNAKLEYWGGKRLNEREKIVDDRISRLASDAKGRVELKVRHSC